MKQFSKKSTPSIKKIKKEILKSPVINENESPIKVDIYHKISTFLT